MKTCPSCGNQVKDHHERCVKCGADVSEDALVKLRQSEEVTAKPERPLEKLRYLKEFVPKREVVSRMMPHPTGWILGISIPVILCVAILHALLLPEKPASAKKKKPDAELKQKSQFKRCLEAARAKKDLECSQITGTAEGLRRFTCTVARLSADYTRCTAKLTGRFGRCLARCGQRARGCSSTCSATGAQSWTDTARCLMPCWKDELNQCIVGCFKPGTGPAPAPPPANAPPSAI
jgi:hypothetical protein